MCRNETSNFKVYVGMTGLTPEDRFHNHKRGHKASRAVKNHGVRFMRPFFDHLERISYEDAKRLEGELAESLRRADTKSKGDTERVGA